MTRLTPETELPQRLSAAQAVKLAYATELERACQALVRGLPVMIECDKELTPFFYKCLRDVLKKQDLQCQYLDGRPRGDEPQGLGMMAMMVLHLRDAVRGAVDKRVVVLPHLDLLTTSSGGLTSEAREVISLLYENPQLLWLGFKDPSFALPRVIQNLFPHKESLLGIPRERLGQLVTQRESRKLGKDGLDVYRLYKYVSGTNAVRLRRLLSALDGEDYPQNAEPAWTQIRRSTLTSGLDLPQLDLDDDIGGYAKVKRKLRDEILDVVLHLGTLDDPEEIQRIEALIPKGMIFWGPPGTGKTLFAKALAAALGAAVTVVSGPELKSRWVGESEENLRQVFIKARQAAPAIIIFDELDSFAAARGTFTGSGVEHSMVNQLLTEMDGFRKNELVFVVGTTNFVESLDAALLRPGRFEFHLEIPFPKAEDRRTIFQIYDQKLGLKLSKEALDHAVRLSGGPTAQGGRYSGDHIQALCRTLARMRLREKNKAETSVLDIDRAHDESFERPELTKDEEHVVATHEAGHAVVALHCKHVPPIDRISIKGDVAGALGFVSYSDPANRHVMTRGQLLDSICVLFGGREAEELLLDDLSIGSAHDLERATATARALVEEFGMGPKGSAVADFIGDPHRRLADETRTKIDGAVETVLNAERTRCQTLLREHQAEVEALRDLLLEHKVVDRNTFKRAIEKT